MGNKFTTMVLVILAVSLVACAGKPIPAAITPTATSPLPVSTPVPSSTSTQTGIPTATQIEIPTATITPASIATEALDPLALNEVNAGTQMKRLAIFGTGEAHDLAWSPDGKVLAVATGRGAWLYDGVTLEETGFIDVNNSVTALAFRPDGKALLAADKNAYISVWDIQSGQMTGKFASGMLGISQLAYGTDGQIAASGSLIVTDYARYDILVWDGLSGNQVFKDENEFSLSRALAFSPNGRLLAFANIGGTHILDMVTKKIIASNSVQPNYLVFNPDSSKIFYESEKNGIGSWDFSTNQVNSLEECHDRIVGGNGILLCNTDTGTMLMSMADGHVIRQLNLKLNSYERTYIDGIHETISPNGNILARTSAQGNVDIIDMNDAKSVKSISFTNFNDKFEGVATGMATIDGKSKYLVATSNNAGQIQVWDIQTGQVVRTLDAGSPNVYLAFSPDRSTLVSMNKYGALTLWDIQNSRKTTTTSLLKKLLPNGGSIEGILFSPDGLNLAIGTSDKPVFTINLQAPLSTLTFIENSYSWKSAFYEPAGHIIYFGWVSSSNPDATFPLTDGTTKATLMTFNWKDVADNNISGEGNGVIEAAVMSSDGQYLAYGVGNGKIFVMDMETQRVVAKLSGHGVNIYQIYLSSIRSLAFSPQSHLLVSVGYDGTTRLWNALTGAERGKLNVCCYANFTADGRYLVTAGDGVIRVWGIPAP